MGQVCATEESTAVRPHLDLDSPSSASQLDGATRPPALLREVPEVESSTEHHVTVPFTPVKELRVASIILIAAADDANEMEEFEFEGPITPARPAPPQLIEGWLVDTLGFRSTIDVKGDRELLGLASADRMEPSENDFIYKLRGPTTPARPTGPPTLMSFFAAALR